MDKLNAEESSKKAGKKIFPNHREPASGSIQKPQHSVDSTVLLAIEPQPEAVYIPPETPEQSEEEFATTAIIENLANEPYIDDQEHVAKETVAIPKQKTKYHRPRRRSSTNIPLIVAIFVLVSILLSILLWLR